MACSWSLVTPATSLNTSSSLFPTSSTPKNPSFSFTNTHINTNINLKYYTFYSFTKNHTICKAAEYQFPDPIPEFADSETEKFKAHLVKKLTKKDIYGDELDEVVGICTEIFSKFLHEEYGGPGTLLVLPFIDMADTVNESGLTGGPQAARAAVKWAQANVDKDWKEWTNST
ncbi:protein PLASTID REDOX INSENSITIVE 2, chloroplastic-like [Silene latifolia]|uniref:protein PLASTID REDOX INSENSITIVE 2, chloroplastic-like n=1 Tax=Silene latifolia TaxID=37657 RepID=UPI003D7766E8